MNGIKCLTAAAILSALTSKGNHVAWCLGSFSLWETARCSPPLHATYKVAPRQRLVAKPSVTIQSWSEGRGNTMDLYDLRASCAVVNVC